MRKLFFNKWIYYMEKQSYKFSNKKYLFGAWKDFNKTFCGIFTYSKWMFKLHSILTGLAKVESVAY